MNHFTVTPFLITLMGPTGTGKSNLALALAEEFPVEIISVDSVMVYRTLDIGSAKPSIDERKKVNHYLVDICDPTETYSVGRFRRDALRAIEDIVGKNKKPLLVGGTMLYFKALLQGLSHLPSADINFRNRLLKEAEEKGWPALHERLKKVDPIAADRIQPNDKQRIERALEVYELTGKNLSDWHKTHLVSSLPYPVVNITLWPTDRDRLGREIAIRFDKMLDAGLIEETKNLLQRCELLQVDCPALHSVGYQQVAQYLRGQLTQDEMRSQAIIKTRQLAKRQMTWLRHWPNLVYFDPYDPQLREKVMKYLRLKMS